MGSFVSGVIQVKSLIANSIIRIGCDRDGSRQLNIRVGEQSGSARVQQLNADQAFLSFDTGGWPTGCEIKATIDNGTEGTSDPYPLGLLLRLPSVDSFQWTDDISPSGFKTAILTGTNLETIGKAGMAADQGTAVEGLPVPVSNGGEKQTLKILLPFPPANPQAPLYVWLRGEAGGRLTTIREQPQTRISTVQP